MWTMQSKFSFFLCRIIVATDSIVVYVALLHFMAGQSRPFLVDDFDVDPTCMCSVITLIHSNF